MMSEAPIDPGVLRDGDLGLKLVEYAIHPYYDVPTYYFRLVTMSAGAVVGRLNLRAASNPILSCTAATLAAMLNRSIGVIGTRRVRCACLFLWREGWGLIRSGSPAIPKTLLRGDLSKLRARSLSKS
jgi:hypothetical protein